MPTPEVSLLTTQADDLASRSWSILRSWMVDSYKLHLSASHEAVLQAMLKDFAKLTVGLKSGRIAYPLSPGGGKSQAILALITALYELQLPYPVMVNASRAASLAELVSDLETMGKVPESRDGWGLLHSVPSAPRQSSPEATSARYLFTTHARIRRRKGEPDSKQRDITALSVWKDGEERRERMIFYDESILISDSWSIPRRTLFSTIKGLDELTYGMPGSDLREAVEYLQGCLPVLKEELDTQLSTHRAARPVLLPDLSEADRERFKNALKDVPGVNESIFDLLDIAHTEIRAAVTPGKEAGAYISFHIAIPSSLQRIAVLDASYPIRLLCHADDSVSLTDDPVIREGVVKTYPDAEVYLVRHGGGRSGVERSARGDRGLFKELAEIVKTGAPDTEEWLLVVYKDRPRVNRYHVPIQDTILTALREARVPNLERIHFLTYGQETSSNAYRYIPNAILVGVMQRSDEDLYGSFIGQALDWQRKLSAREIKELSISESTHVAFQAMHRTRMRKMQDGKALPTRTWIFYHNPKALWTGLASLMPGLTPRRWGNLALPTLEHKLNSISEAIVTYLNALPESVFEIKPSEIKAAVCPQSNRMTFYRALFDALPRLAWATVGTNKAQKLYRKPL